MKIKVGVCSLKEARYFLAHGADEIYCGFSRIPSHVVSGRNLEGMRDIMEAIKLAHSFKKKIHIAVNEVHTEKNREIIRHLKTITRAGIDGVIIKDIALLSFLNRIGLRTKFLLSSLALCFNLEALKFYKQFNITGITLPEHLLPEEADGILNNRLGIKTGIFFHAKEYCTNINGLCFRQFGPNNDFLCDEEFKLDKKPFIMPRPDLSLHLKRLYDFYVRGAHFLKIGRSTDSAESMISFREASMLLKILDGSPKRDDFIKEGLRIRASFKKLYESNR